MYGVADQRSHRCPAESRQNDVILEEFASRLGVEPIYDIGRVTRGIAGDRRSDKDQLTVLDDEVGSAGVAVTGTAVALWRDHQLVNPGLVERSEVDKRLHADAAAGMGLSARSAKRLFGAVTHDP